MRAHLPSLAAGTMTALAAIGCTDNIPTAPPASFDLAPAAAVTSVEEPASGVWAKIIHGETGPGSVYAIYIPRTDADTPIDVVFYAHGFRDVGTAIDLRDQNPNDQDNLADIREALGQAGFAVAYSSFSDNGFAVKDGAQRTHQLRGLVASQMAGRQGRSFIVGHSLGGGIGLYLAEKYPDQYDGALLMCGMVGGSLLQTQYVGNVRALVDHFYPGALPGGVLTPPGRQIEMNEVARLVLMNPDAARAIASTAQTALPIIPLGDVRNPASPYFQTLVGSLYGALSFHARGIEDVLDLTNGHSPFDNQAPYTVGTAFLADAAARIDAINETVARYTADRSAWNYLERHFTPTGQLRIPVLTLHNRFDPGVPAFHEVALRRAADAAGAGAMLRQEFARQPFGHCAISSAEAVAAFQQLRSWPSPN